MVNGSTVVTHTETYGVNITGSQAFSVNSTWALQPGIAEYSKGSPLGAWLPQIAGNFDGYEILGLKFSYRAACSTLTPGLVAFGFEPNPESSHPTTFQELRNMRSCDGSVHANLDFDIGRYVRKNLLTRKGQVINLPSYDAGKVFFASVGSTDGAQLGFVDVHYTVRLFNPQSANSSQGSTMVYDPVLPVTRYSAVLSGGATNNCASECFGTFNYLISNAAATAGADLFTKIVASGSANVTIDGCQYVHAANSFNMLQAKMAGRYRVEYQLAVDFEDLKLFAMVPFTSSAATPTIFAVAQYQILTSPTTGSVGTLPCISAGHRGYTGVASLDPNPGTDLVWRQGFDVLLEAGGRLMVAVGVRTYNSVSTTTANVAYRAGLGPSAVTIAYLGA